MSEPPHSADPKPDELLPPLDADEPVTDPIAVALGSAAPVGLPEPLLGSDEDEAAPDFGAMDDTAERSPFLAGLAARDEADAEAPALDAAPADFDAEAAAALPAFADAPAGEEDPPAEGAALPAPGPQPSFTVETEPG